MSDSEAIKDYLAKQSWQALPRGTMNALADRCGVSHASVYKWSQGHTAPKSHHWGAIEETLGLEPRTLADLAGISSVEFTSAKRKSLLAQVNHARREMARAQEALANLETEVRSLI
jgi:DNA-binding transcriptional regulator YdaS (Cro superfamily)